MNCVFWCDILLEFSTFRENRSDRRTDKTVAAVSYSETGTRMLSMPEDFCNSNTTSHWWRVIK
jgi:hypothetical protein